MTISLQKSASIQKRTSPLKFDHFRLKIPDFIDRIFQQRCLHLACWKDDYSMVRLILELGASKDIRNTYGELALENLAAPGKPARARFICCRSVDSLLTVALQELGHFDVADFSTAFVALAKLPDSKSIKDNRLEAPRGCAVTDARIHCVRLD